MNVVDHSSADGRKRLRLRMARRVGLAVLIASFAMAGVATSGNPNTSFSTPRAIEFDATAFGSATGAQVALRSTVLRAQQAVRRQHELLHSAPDPVN